MKNLTPWLAGFLLSCAQAAWAGQAGPAEIRALIQSFVERQTASLPGRANIRIAEVDPRLALPACAKPEAFLPPGSQLVGNGTVGVRCPGNKRGRTLFVPIHVTISTRLLISARPLQAGTPLSADDLTSRDGEMTELRMLTDPAQAIGKMLRASVGPGQVLRRDMLRTPYAVRQGQTVQLRVSGEGFSIRSSGQALNNAAPGENVQVRTPSGRVASGTALEDGSVNIRP